MLPISRDRIFTIWDEFLIESFSEVYLYKLRSKISSSSFKFC
jgi:hypothetical protein